MLTIIYKQKEHSNREPPLTKTIMKKVKITLFPPPKPTCRISREADHAITNEIEKKARLGIGGRAPANLTIPKTKMAEDRTGRNALAGTITGE